MPTTSRAAQASPSPSDAAASLLGAPLARLLVRRDGDAVAAAGVLGRALREVGVPVQASPTDTVAARERRAGDGDPDAVTVAVGPVADADVSLGGDEPAAGRAAAIARELDVEPDRALALAGIVAAGEVPADAAPAVLEAADADRRPGVGLATDDLAAGLAGSTLFHAPFSGDEEAAAAALADAGVDPDAEPTAERGRAVASLVAVTATDGPAPERAAETVERALRPLDAPGPVPTVEGYADLLDVVATVDPGLALAHALGECDVQPVRSQWRDAGAAAHDAVADAEPSRYDGVVVLDAADAAPALVARLARDCRAPEPVAVAVGDGEIGVATVGPDAGPIADAVASATGGDGDAASRRAVVRRVEDRDAGAIADAVRDARTEGSP